jgi:hypothetical protein
MSMQVQNYAKMSADGLASVEAEVGGHRTIDDVLKWGFTQGSATISRQIISDVIVQDEFTHDLIVPWREGLVLVYGTT